MKLSKIFYWTLSLTWGLLLTLLGLTTALVLLCCGKKPYRHMYGYVFTIGDSWGGLNLGPITLVCKTAHLSTLNHEFGHSIQNCYFGPFMPFLVAIPSAIRYWYREWLVRSGRKKYYELSPYDSIWFEGSATSIGNAYFDFLKNI